ncbi:hypothetical protein ACFW5V_32480 [Streptomyces sp. NPDC058762]|uniref:hypothetical protein n=1 Tax=Streptomyces sp. NPDC058762 TaxID=3346629 RepID=UPI0036BBEE3A
MSAEEVLYVLNGRETVPLHQLAFLVITGTYTPHEGEPPNWPFAPGTILVVQHTPTGTREFLGLGRSPFTDWEDMGRCTYQDNDLRAALEVAALVTSDRPRGYYEWTADGLAYCVDQDAGEEAWCSRQDSSIVRVADHAGRGPWPGIGSNT